MDNANPSAEFIIPLLKLADPTVQSCSPLSINGKGLHSDLKALNALVDLFRDCLKRCEFSCLLLADELE